VATFMNLDPSRNKRICVLVVSSQAQPTQLLFGSRPRLATERFFYSSSACVYNVEKQTSADVTALKEEDAYPAMPDDGYGWEKRFSERTARHFREDYGIATRAARYHNGSMTR
jgi:GDP-D-mannose 3', 5'-epimerase